MDFKNKKAIKKYVEVNQLSEKEEKKLLDLYDSKLVARKKKADFSQMLKDELAKKSR